MDNNKKLYNEFKDYPITDDNEIKQYIEFSFTQQLENIDNLRQIKSYNLYKYNNIQYKIGQTVDKVEIKKSGISRF
jgi:hypothetical protein